MIPDLKLEIDCRSKLDVIPFSLQARKQTARLNQILDLELPAIKTGLELKNPKKAQKTIAKLRMEVTRLREQCNNVIARIRENDPALANEASGALEKANRFLTSEEKGNSLRVNEAGGKDATNPEKSSISSKAPEPKITNPKVAA